MALRRRKKKDANGDLITKPVRCGICKEEKTIYTVHGGIATGKYGGRTCCDNCFKKLQAEQLKSDEYEIGNSERGQSEAEYQIERRWGI